MGQIKVTVRKQMFSFGIKKNITKNGKENATKWLNIRVFLAYIFMYKLLITLRETSVYLVIS